MTPNDKGAGDGRGILSGGYLNQDRPMTRETWLAEVFPEWGTFLNQQVENDVVKPGTVALWWLSGPSWCLKTSAGGVFLIDCYSGPSMYTSYEFCGVCRISGAPTINWLRLSPMVHDPWKFKTLDASFMTHLHQDHCDIYTIKATLATTNCKYVGPMSTIEKTRRFQVPEERLVPVKPGDDLPVRGATVKVLINYDEIARRTGVPLGRPRTYGESAVSYLFETDGGNILFLGDSVAGLPSTGASTWRMVRSCRTRPPRRTRCATLMEAPPRSTPTSSRHGLESIGRSPANHTAARRPTKAVGAAAFVPIPFASWLMAAPRFASRPRPRRRGRR